MIDIQILKSPDAKWDERILKSTFGTYYHTTSNSHHLSRFNNYEPIYVLFKKNSSIIGQHSLFLRKRGSTFFKKKMGHFLSPFYFWNKSILIFDNSFRDEILQSFCEFIKDKEFIGSDSPLTNYFLNLPHTKIGTVILEIKQNFEETISKRDSTSTQKYVGLAANSNLPTKKEVTAKKCENLDAIKIYYDLLSEHRKNLKLETESYEAIKSRILTLNTEKAGGALIAYHNEKPISGIMYTNFNGWIHNMGVANTQYSLQKKLSSLDYLRCFLISIGVKSQAKYFDFGGIALEPKTKKESGIRHSQTKWGGIVVKYNRYSNI